MCGEFNLCLSFNNCIAPRMLYNVYYGFFYDRNTKLIDNVT